MHYPNVHLYTKDLAWKLIIIFLPAMYKMWNFQKCNVSHGGIAQVLFLTKFHNNIFTFFNCPSWIINLKKPTSSQFICVLPFKLAHMVTLHVLHTAQVIRGGTIHRCIDISRYFSRDTYRDIIFYNHNFLYIFFFNFCNFFFHNDFYLVRKDT